MVSKLSQPMGAFVIGFNVPFDFPKIKYQSKGGMENCGPGNLSVLADLKNGGFKGQSRESL